MPRPKGGYKLKDGTKVPGVTTITGRFKDAGGLIQWAFRCGLDGLDMNRSREEACDAGTACHDMIDAHLHQRTFDPSPYEVSVLKTSEHAYLGFLEWEEQTKLQLVASEISLVSEKHGFGGTFDGISACGSLRILDYKTSSGCYPEMLIQLAAYALLWEENHPPLIGASPQPIMGLDLLRISKPDAPNDPVSFHHHHWSAEVIPMAGRAFLIMRELYDLDKRIKGLL